MSLEFLSKKSWHTANLANQEKVWMAEQKQQEEERKMKELTTQIQMEREKEELERVAGRAKSKDRPDKGINWMYQEVGGSRSSEGLVRERNEEFLLGKPITGDDLVLEREQQEGESVLRRMAASSSSSRCYSKPAEAREVVDVKETSNDISFKPAPVLDRNEEFRLRHEDPMFLVSQRQKEKQQEVMSKRALYERVTGKSIQLSRKENDVPSGTDTRIYDERKENNNRHRRRKNRHKKKRKRRHRSSRRRSRSESRSRSRSSSESRSSEENVRGSGSGKRMHYPERKKRPRDRSTRHDSRRPHGRQRGKNEDLDDNFKPSRKEGMRTKRDRGRGGDFGGSQRRTMQRSRSSSSGSGNSRESNRLRHNARGARYGDHGSASGGSYDEIDGNAALLDAVPVKCAGTATGKVSGYGLQGTCSSSFPAVPERKDSLGPEAAAIAKKKQEMQSQREAMRKSRRPASMTSVERAEILQRMQMDACRRDAELSNVTKTPEENSSAHEAGTIPSAEGSFLRELKLQAHGVTDGGGPDRNHRRHHNGKRNR